MRLSVAALSLTAMLLSGVALADPPSPSSTTVQGVTVTGEKVTADKVKSFVDTLTGKAAPGVQMARWDRSICTGVLGLPEEHAQYMNDRIAANAVAAGLETGKPGCKPNVLVMIAPDADAFTKQIVRTQPRAFGSFGVAHNRGGHALKAFVNTPRPVRWWHVTQT